MLAFPSVVAIMLVEVVNILMFGQGPIEGNIFYLLVWLVMQSAAGFFFGYLSDFKIRKNVLVLSQVLGFVGGLILFFFELKIWVIVLIALIFNPLPVARAALLDNFKKVSPTRIIGLSFFAQFLPWVFFSFINQFHYQKAVVWVLLALAINIFLTIFMFKDSFDEGTTHHSKRHLFNSKLLLVMLAFILSETTFYTVWDYLEYAPQIRSWVSVTTFGTLFGIVIAMIYPRLPHIAIISLCYFLGAATTLDAIYEGGGSFQTGAVLLVSSIGVYAKVGGLYLPFVADLVIEHVGPKHRAFGSALIEFCGTIATLVAALINICFKMSPIALLWVLTFFYLTAGLAQRYSDSFKRKRKQA